MRGLTPYSLRRAHFDPRKRRKNERRRQNNNWPTIDYLRLKWIREAELPVHDDQATTRDIEDTVDPEEDSEQLVKLDTVDSATERRYNT